MDSSLSALSLAKQSLCFALLKTNKTIFFQSASYLLPNVNGGLQQRCHLETFLQVLNENRTVSFGYNLSIILDVQTWILALRCHYALLMEQIFRKSNGSLVIIYSNIAWKGDYQTFHRIDLQDPIVENSIFDAQSCKIMISVFEEKAGFYERRSSN